MKRPQPYKTLLINLLISVAISLIVNFSYLVYIVTNTTQASTMRRQMDRMGADNTTFAILQMVFFILLAFILLGVFSSKAGRERHNLFIRRMSVCLLITCVLYFFAPHMTRSGRLEFLIQSRHPFNPMLVLKCSFTLVVVVLFGKIYELIYQKQNITIENERLKNENLQSRYNVLVSQINPHFLFNSLTSLAMLVREHENDAALNYIDRMSDTFRYIIQNGQNGMTTLKDEMQFLDAYKYLFEIRYSGKIMFDVDTDPQFNTWQMPSLSLQPLIENAVKHNSITTAHPLHVAIYTKDGSLYVSNDVVPKMDDIDTGTGIGLKNLASRYMLLTGSNVEIIDDGQRFTVRLPLVRS